MVKMKLCLVLVLFTICHTCSSKSSSRGGVSRGGYSRGSYSYRSSSFRATNLRTWSTTQKAAALTVGAVFISRRMRVRYGSPDYYREHDVRICRNAQKFPEFNGSTTSYGWFMCPLEKEENGFCCGADGLQYCCTYWKSPNAIGAFVGFALLGIGFIVFLVFAVCFFLRMKKRKNPPPQNSPASVAYVSNPQGVQMGYDNKGMEASQSPPPYAVSNPTGQGAYGGGPSPYPVQQYAAYPQLGAGAPA